MKRTLVIAALLFAVPVLGAGGAAKVERALSDELARALAELSLANEPQPYFLSYRLDALEVLEVGATFGSAVRHSLDRYRILSNELRVGSAARDNTNFFSFQRGSGGVSRAWNGAVRVPIDDDYQELRRQAWLLTDASYKTALENLARKKAALENRRLPGDLPDFTSAEAARIQDVDDQPETDRDEAEALVVGLSAEFRKLPDIDHSTVRLKSIRQRARYLDSEQRTFLRLAPMIELTIAATAQAADGTRVTDVVAHYGRSLDELPGRSQLVTDVRRLGERISSAVAGSEVERYNGPVLFVGQASAEVFHQVFAPGVIAWRPPVAEEERLERRLAEMMPALSNRLGGRVLARTMRLLDDPLASEVDGVPLFGGYLVDDEGTPAAETGLVERGILKALVASRNPARGAPVSTGNRRGPTALPSNLLLWTSEGRTEQQLMSELFVLMDERDLEYGIVVRRLANPLLVSGFDKQAATTAGQLGGVVEAVKVFRDGREEAVRDPRFSGLTAASFRDIVAASQSRTVYTAPFKPAFAAVANMASATLGSTLAGPALVSVAVPDLLFEELTIAVSTEPVPRPPVIPHPYFERRGGDGPIAHSQ